MRLSFYCKSCQKENYIKTNATNRHELEMEIGKEFNERCRHCGNFTKKHINRLHAEIDPKFLLILSTITLIVTFILVWHVAIISSSLITVPTFIWFTQKKKASNFNKTMVK